MVRSSIRSLHHLGRAPKQFLIELPRLRLGLGPQLPLQHADAHLVLLERGSPPPLAGIEPHERAVHRLLQGIQPEQPHRRLNRALRARGLALLGQQPRQGLQRHLPQPLPLGDEPLLEQRLVHGEAQQQVPAVQLGRLLQRLGVPSATRRSKVTTSTSTPAGFSARVCPSIRNGGGWALGERPA